MRLLLAVVALGACLVASEARLRKAAPASAALHKAKKAEASASLQDISATLGKVDSLLTSEGGEAAAKVAEAQAEDAFAKMRFAEAKVELSKARARKAHAKAGMPPSVYQYGSPMGNGAADYRTPHYGSFAGSYGPIGAPGAPAGFGSFSPFLDPRGFGAAMSNYSAPWENGVHPMWPVPPNPFPLTVPQPYNPWSAMPPFPQQGYAKLMEENGAWKMTPWGSMKDIPSMTTLMGPNPFGPYGMTAHPFYPNGPSSWASTPNTFGMYPGFGFPAHGVIPTSRPGMGFAGSVPGVNPFFMPPNVGFQGMNPQMAGMMPVPPQVAAMSGYTGARFHPLVPHPALGTHPALSLTGNGAFYPHPDWDRYGTVPKVPPPPADGVGAADGAGSA